MATENVSARYLGLATWPLGEALEAMWEAQMSAVAAVRPALPALERAAVAAADRLRAGGRLAFAGAGASARIAAQDGAELPPTFGWPPERLVYLIAGGPGALIASVEGAEDDPETARRLVREAGLGEADVLVGVAASGATPFTVAALEEGRARGALAIALANVAAAPIFAHADHALLVETGPEAIAGSTRMKAGTAQKVALNLLSTVVMMRMGGVYQGLMVGMKPANSKLRARAERMVMRIANCERGVARHVLEESAFDIRVACLRAMGADADVARAALRASGGDLAGAIARVKEALP